MELNRQQGQMAIEPLIISNLKNMLAARLALERSLGVEFIAKTALASGVLQAAQINTRDCETTAASLSEPAKNLAQLRQQIAACRRCILCEHRQQVVTGQGPLRPELMCIGEAPGAEEEMSGQHFVGSAGLFLAAMIEKGLKKPRDSVYISDAVKCRPPHDRAPAAAEIEACLLYLREEIRQIRPQAILCLGRVAAQALLGTEENLEKLRGRWHEFDGIPVRVTYQPAYLLHQRQIHGGKTIADREAYNDLKAVAGLLGWEV